MSPIDVFIGYDSSESLAFHVAVDSLMTRASFPVTIHPLIKRQLRSVFEGRSNDVQSTEFSFTRFLVPYLMNYQGFALFMDCDMLILDDVEELWSLRSKAYSVQVVKHDQRPVEETKMLGQAQTKYERKNWTSFMIFNCARCKVLTPELVNAVPADYLRKLRWLADEEIGELPAKWNHLVDVEPPLSDPANVHYTLGGPWWKQWAKSGYTDQWIAEARKMVDGSTPEENNMHLLRSIP
jgi:lipopolysaccharide biosynthesis glycosyltransferase